MSSNLSHDRAFRALQERDSDCDNGRIPSKQHSVKIKGDNSGGEDCSIRLRIVQIRMNIETDSVLPAGEKLPREPP